MISGHFVADIGENADIGGGNNPDEEVASHHDSVCRSGAMRHANDLKFDLALVSRDWKKSNLIFCRLSNAGGLFLNLEATCYCSEWQARANRLPALSPLAASEGPGLRMFSSGAPPSLAF
jgi:hypothetical protein